jgi:tetratricopeptide (TPR) repeat protein
MYRSSWFLATALLGTNVAVVQQVAGAKSAVEVGRIAKAITVEIKAIGSTDIGSGILLQRQGDVYTILTSGHVANKSAAFNLKTADGQVHQVIAGSIRLAGNNIDLGVMKFRSNNNYTVAKIGTSNSLEELSLIYVAGFPERTKLIEAGTLNITEGKVKGKANQGNSMGYSLIYSNDTYYGMSGGPVLNSEGELVAIHGQGEREENGQRKDERGRPIKTNRNLGITIERFGSVALAMGVQLDQKIAVLPQFQPLNASDYLVRGREKMYELDYLGARDNYNQAIKLDPKYSSAYIERATLKTIRYDLEGALADYDQAIILEPQNPDYYSSRGGLKSGMLDDFQGALADYNQSIALRPDNADMYSTRAYLKEYKLNDFQGALADYNQSIYLRPNNADMYTTRAKLKEDRLNDFQGALADYNQAIILKPKALNVYLERANLKAYKLDDFQGALSDYSKAINIDPENASVYFKRANLKSYKLNDFKGALSDYSKAIALETSDYHRSSYYFKRAELQADKFKDFKRALSDYNQMIILQPRNASAYYNRGILKYLKLKDKTGGIQDLQQAAQLYNEEGKIPESQKTIEVLRQLGVN